MLDVIIGYVTDNQTMVALLSASPAKYPEDMRAGFFVARRNETDTWWDTDPLLHLECISGMYVLLYEGTVF